MTVTVLTGVSDVLLRERIIDTALAALTSNNQQLDVESVISAWNETLDDLTAPNDFPDLVTEATLTLVTSQRNYDVPSDFAKLAGDDAWPDGQAVFLDETNGRFLKPYPGGFDQMRKDQEIPANYTGLPEFYVIRPTDGDFYLDSSPTAAENGNAYKYLYIPTLHYTNADAATNFPFQDEVTYRLYPAVAQRYRKLAKGTQFFDAGDYQRSLGSAAGMLRQVPHRTSYGP